MLRIGEERRGGEEEEVDEEPHAKIPQRDEKGENGRKT